MRAWIVGILAQVPQSLFQLANRVVTVYETVSESTAPVASNPIPKMDSFIRLLWRQKIGAECAP
jgi:hypothetical protein